MNKLTSLASVPVAADKLLSRRETARRNVSQRKVRHFRTAAGTYSLALCLALLLQGFVFVSPASAQKRARPAPESTGVDQSVARRVPPVVQGEGSRQIAPTSRAITVLPSVNMMALSSQSTLAPQSAAPREIRPIHPPKGTTQRNSKVAIPPQGDGDIEAGPAPAAPISTGVQSPPPSTSFRSDQLDLGSIPPDTMGAVGDNHAVTTTNEKIVIHTRDGRILSTVTLDDFWATVLLGGSPPNTFDPKILYDRFNDRFIIVTQANAQTETSATLVAVSQTADPTGNYNRFAIDADAAATAAGGKWADYPSIGFNNNWISVQVNLFGFGSSGGGFQGPVIYVLDKAAAYNNTLSTVSTFEGSFATCLASVTQETELGCGFTMAPAITEDNTTSTLFLAEDWDSTAAQLRLSRITGTPAAPVLTVGYQFPQSTNSWRFNAPIIGTSGGYLLQRQQNVYALSGNRVTGNDSRIQNTVLRNGSLWAVHHVMLPTVPTAAGAPASTAANPDNHSGVQWWEIDPTIVNAVTGTPAIQRARIEDPTATNCHNGSGGTVAGCTPQGQFFAYATISVNQNDDVLIGYSRFSNLTLPKAAYSFRASADTVNTTRDSATFREGVGNYNIGAGSPFNIRWGDYSAAMVDPTNDTDFWTIQEFADFQREIFGPGQFAGVWATWWALIKPPTTTTTAGQLIITEFRLRGPGGPRDEFIELFNPGNTPLTVSTTDGSDGWAVAFSANGTTATALVAIPNGTTIPARGHYLVVNNVAAAGIAPYSLNAYPNTEVRPSNGDAMYTPDLADNGGVAVFRTANPANFAAGTRMDSVGFSSIAPGLFKEGNGIPAITTQPVGNFSFYRSPCPNNVPTFGSALNCSSVGAGQPKDSGANENDFVFVSVDGVSPTAGIQRLGAPGPENLDSGLANNPLIVTGLFDPAVSGSSAPNRARDFTSDPANNSTFGTLTIRRNLRNDTSAPITRLRFRIIDITTFPAPAGFADLRARTSVQSVVTLSGGGTTTAQGTTLEAPPTQGLGGGFNSTLSAGTVTLADPLNPGVTISLQFLLGVQQTGLFRFFLNIEALP
ncbi:MAG: lamin tail domain-containing protein [Rubrivivax sp.]|nr:lamin tail domain-containing protein [Pyrinomonadaceae bacterium]